MIKRSKQTKKINLELNRRESSFSPRLLLISNKENNIVTKIKNLKILIELTSKYRVFILFA